MIENSLKSKRLTDKSNAFQREVFGRLDRLCAALRIKRVWTLNGLRTVVHNMLKELLTTREERLVFYTPFSRQIVPQGEGGITYRLASEEDLPSLSVFSAVYQPEEFRIWIDAGDFVFLAMERGTPVGFQILSHQSRKRKPHSYFPLEPGQLWVVDIYTLPEYRSYQIGSNLRKYRNDYLWRAGYRESVGSICTMNLASLRMVRKLPSRKIVHFRFFRFLMFTRFKQSNDGAVYLEKILHEHAANQLELFPQLTPEPDPAVSRLTR